ncbi:D-serine ammonia-lyase [Pseudomonas sp. CCC3.1]|uniref:D-serine ammonia-lyase n=1 Tax=Pseudomonas sp. CCC3.1 TaxID=3048607 RepID=UPI002AC962BD|nr:D-serine ammonia-lyase [Pseudomonas sp. CCC3.1]MEB0205719.1 D-serine ammonia-lyase [Pseudomonas sp. CCC3.1]WPX35925.1 D-serine ammonia-lyase [Pseudomonas sp. CCC3.1]
MILGRTRESWYTHYPLIRHLVALQPTTWFNPGVTPVAQAIGDVGLTAADVADASARLNRFAAYLQRAFPETVANNGIIESDIVPIPHLQHVLSERYDQPLPGAMWLKRDSHLPISGSIKARGGIYEVLKHAEDLALAAELLTLDDDYALLDSDKARAFFGQYKIAVGSTGNLGMSIGIMGAALGFQVTVHMSADARQWKKDTLRCHGVEVIEYASDYSVAVAQGRQQAEADPTCHFVDDENSVNLFLGYSVAAERLKTQLATANITVDAQHPLFVYLPCGVGGAPGGVAFGLKLAFGDAVHCIFAEPTHSPCMLLGVYTGLHDEVSVQDFGIDNVTAADGLAVGRASGFVGKAMQRLLDGFYTVSDDEMYSLLALMERHEGLRLEPSALAGVPGIARVLADQQGYWQRAGLNLQNWAQATHLVWATGGSMVPGEEMDAYLAKGRELLSKG